MMAATSATEAAEEHAAQHQQAECLQEFALLGYPPPPEVRQRLDEAELCLRAEAAGFPVVMEIESLDDRSKDRVAACR